MRISYALAVLALATASCGGSDGSSSNTNSPTAPPTLASRATVQATPQSVFNPASVEIAVGGIVTWAIGSVTHNVVFQRSSDDGSDYYGGGRSSPGAPEDIPASTNTSVSRTFPNAGTFRYQCTLHAGMVGEVRVR
jgi:plastocyanin